MTSNNKAALPGANQKETASKSQDNNNSSPVKHQDQKGFEGDIKKMRRILKRVIVKLAVLGLISASLAQRLLKGLQHD